MTRMFGVGEEFGEDAILGRLEGMKEVIEQVNRQFKDPVCIYLVKCLIYPLVVTTIRECCNIYIFCNAGFDNIRMRVHP